MYFYTSVEYIIIYFLIYVILTALIFFNDKMEVAILNIDKTNFQISEVMLTNIIPGRVLTGFWRVRLHGALVLTMKALRNEYNIG